MKGWFKNKLSTFTVPSVEQLATYSSFGENLQWLTEFSWPIIVFLQYFSFKSQICKRNKHINIILFMNYSKTHRSSSSQNHAVATKTPLLFFLSFTHMLMDWMLWPGLPYNSPLSGKIHENYLHENYINLVKTFFTVQTRPLTSSRFLKVSSDWEKKLCLASFPFSFVNQNYVAYRHKQKWNLSS